MGHLRPLLRLALPNYVALLSAVVAGIVDVAWVARLGPAAVAAVAVATNVENALLGVILLVNGGVVVVLAGRIAAGDRPGARAAIRAAWRIFAALTPVVVLAGWALRRPLAALFLPGPGAASLAVEYFAVSLPAVAIFYAQQVVDGIFAGHGDTRTPMRLALVANALLVTLDPVVIYGWGPAPACGVVGAAVATAFGRAVALAIGLLLLRRRRAFTEPAGPTGSAVRALVATGAPIAGDFLVRMAGALAVVALVGRFGVTAVAAYGIGMKALYFATMAFYAIRNAATIHTPRVLGSVGGEAGGAVGGEASEARRQAVGRQVLRLALGAGVLAGVVFAGSAAPLMRLFTGDAQVIAAGTVFLRCVGGYLVPIAGVIALGGFLVASGRGARLFAVTVVGITAQTVLGWSLATAIGLPGVWLAMGLSALLQLGLVLRLARLGPRRPAVRSAASRAPVPPGGPRRAGSAHTRSG
ncbi:MATE family efflux transporter [Dactylosporangium siamense]|uniref:MATE family efflux transporter n=1 Tax=Dactylosporangium siamense TaxID=685454 RepID=UPI0019429447|nr:MATE family efflux transporter [Dactylosporangium siamense]